MEDQERYATALGERLRNVRQQQGLSLHEVEERSQGELKASVVGAYERGERAVSVNRLHTLAAFYRVPMASLLPGPEPRRHEEPVEAGLRIDLTRLETTTEERTSFGVVERYLSAIQARRGDYNGRVITVRGSDVEALAAVLDRDPADLTAELVGVGIATPRD